MESSIQPSGHWLRRGAARTEFALRQIIRRPRISVPWPSRQAIAIATSGFVALFILIMVLFDAAAITAARALPPLVIAVFREITDFGKAGWFLYPLAALMIALVLTPPDLPRSVQLTLTAIFARAAFLFFAIGVPYWFNTTIKQVIGRARPFVGGSANPCLFHPFSWGPEYASLPSNHATTVCAAAIAIGALWPRARTALWIYAALIMASRVVITAHHPSDVLAGAVVGMLGAILVRNYFAARRLVFGVSAQGSIEPFAGPSWRRIKAAGRALLSDR
jgi:membrane-associated phospholipid phosphatase